MNAAATLPRATPEVAARAAAEAKRAREADERARAEPRLWYVSDADGRREAAGLDDTTPAEVPAARKEVPPSSRGPRPGTAPPIASVKFFAHIERSEFNAAAATAVLYRQHAEAAQRAARGGLDDNDDEEQALLSASRPAPFDVVLAWARDVKQEFAVALARRDQESAAVFARRLVATRLGSYAVVVAFTALAAAAWLAAPTGAGP